LIYARIYVDGKEVVDAGVTATTELSEAHAKELAHQVQKVLTRWMRERAENGYGRQKGNEAQAA
jgi:F0F1-type ATP synthase delta subunit